jgi:hypothetical protein
VVWVRIRENSTTYWAILIMIPQTPTSDPYKPLKAFAQRRSLRVRKSRRFRLSPDGSSRIPVTPRYSLPDLRYDKMHHLIRPPHQKLIRRLAIRNVAYVVEKDMATARRRCVGGWPGIVVGAFDALDRQLDTSITNRSFSIPSSESILAGEPHPDATSFQQCRTILSILHRTGSSRYINHDALPTLWGFLFDISLDAFRFLHQCDTFQGFMDVRALR